MEGNNKNSTTATKPKEKDKRKTSSKPLPPFNVILLDDNDHTYEYVIDMLRQVFGYDDTKGFVLAKMVDKDGKAILLTTHKEHAELKREQIHAHGADIRVATCKGSMSAVVEPAVV